MKIYQISNADCIGGAAKAAFQLNKSLRDFGIESYMLVNNKYGEDEYVYKFRNKNNLGTRAHNYLKKGKVSFRYKKYKATRPSKYIELFSDIETLNDTDFLLKQIDDADIINLHWISLFIDYPSFFSRITKPIVWTLHDMEPFTGGCHYNDGCTKYQTHCGACPQLGSHTYKDLSFKIFSKKAKLFDAISESQLKLVALAPWMKNEILSSPFLSKFEVSIIPNSINTNVFKVRNKEEMRSLFNIPDEKKVILIIAEYINNYRKGYQLAQEALNKLDEDDLLILAIGRNFPEDLKVKIPITYLGHIGNEGLLSAVYNASDIFLLPSIQDNLPNTMLESLACGTPVVGFNIGGIKDSIKQMETGYLATPFDIDDLASGIKKIFSSRENLVRMQEKCRAFSQKEFSPEIQARRYERLYSQILYNYD